MAEYTDILLVIFIAIISVIFGVIVFREIVWFITFSAQIAYNPEILNPNRHKLKVVKKRNPTSYTRQVDELPV